MKNKVLQTGYLFLLTFFTCQLFSYSQVSEKEYMKWFDSKIGPENTSLYNGFLDDGDGVIERNKSYGRTQRYFMGFEYMEGDLVYEEQPYYNFEMKYDLFEDELLLNLKSSRNTILSMRPIKNKVNSFRIGGKEFININIYSEEDVADIEGFAEVLYNGDSFKLLKKHQKKRIVHKTTNGIIYEYVDKNFNFLYFNKNFYRVKKLNDFTKIFPEFKKEIKKYRISKKTKDVNMLSLVQRLQSLISAKKQDVK